VSDIDAARAGDSAAFGRLYDSHVDAVYALCIGLTGDRHAARDLVQDTFVRAWQSLAAFRGESAFSTWLHRIAVTVMLTDRRSARRRMTRVAIEADLDAGDGLAAPTPVTRDDPSLRLDLETAIERLPPGARTVFTMHDIGGYAHADIAAALGIAEGTSKAHLFRARRLLRAMLAP
jgi:RNA polymerase sigma-70 factor, ECF subfamily